MLFCFRPDAGRKYSVISTAIKSSVTQTLSKSTATRSLFRHIRRPFSFSARKDGTGGDNQSRHRRFDYRKRESRAAASEGFVPRDCIPSSPYTPDAWISIIEPILPESLRDSQQDFEKQAIFAEYLLQILVRARRAYNVDILCHLGLEKGRWAAVIWLMREVVDRTSTMPTQPYLRSNLSNLQWSFVDLEDNSDEQLEPAEDPRHVSHPWSSSASLEEISRVPIWLENVGSQYHASAEPLEEETSKITTAADTGLYILRKTALGQIWRSLGRMVLAAAEEPDAAKSSIMPHVLQMIAHLHHMGTISDSMYEYASNLGDYVLKQPLTLHMLSSRILSALSDSVWQAHEIQVKEEKRAAGAQYTFLGHEIPGSKFRVRNAALYPEIWLELILWSCLHGGWIEDGFAILRAIYETKNKARRWTLLCWQNILAQAKSEKDTAIRWSTFGFLVGTPIPKFPKRGQSEDQITIERTIPSEVIVAYIDALVSAFRVGVGKRGMPAGLIVHNIKLLKSFLDLNGMSLPATSWDALLARLLESQGINVEQDPGFVDHILEAVSSTYGEEFEARNTRELNFGDAESPTYVFDGTASVLGLYHRALRAIIRQGDVEGAFKIFVHLQDYTDRNKEKAVRKFASMRQKRPDKFSTQQAPDTNASLSLHFSDMHGANIDQLSENKLNADYPAFSMKMPSSLTGSLVDLITASKKFDFGKYLLSSQDIDGPIIPQSSYGDPTLAGPLIRFATATQDRTLLVSIVDALRSSQSMRHDEASTDEETQFLPEEVILTFLENQIRVRKWEAVEDLLDHVRDTDDVNWNQMQLAQLAREILFHRISISTVVDFDNEHAFRIGPEEAKYSGGQEARSLSWALRIFVDLLNGRWGAPKPNANNTVRRHIRSILGLIADLGPEWAALLRGTKFLKRYQRLHLPIAFFHPILEGLVERWGALAGIRVVEKWCGDFKAMRPDPQESTCSDPYILAEGHETVLSNDAGHEAADITKDTTDEQLVVERAQHVSNQTKADIEQTEEGEDTEVNVGFEANDEDLIRAGGVAAMSKTRRTRAKELMMEPIRVTLNEELGAQANFEGRIVTPNFLTLQILLKGVQKQWREMMTIQEEGRTDHEVVEREVRVAVEWIKHSYSKLGLSKEQIEKRMKGDMEADVDAMTDV